MYNKHNSFPLSMVSKLAQEDQDFVHEIITNTVEKLQWNPVEIARQLKVIIRNITGLQSHLIELMMESTISLDRS